MEKTANLQAMFEVGKALVWQAWPPYRVGFAVSMALWGGGALLWVLIAPKPERLLQRHHLKDKPRAEWPIPPGWKPFRNAVRPETADRPWRQPWRWAAAAGIILFGVLPHLIEPASGPQGGLTSSAIQSWIVFMSSFVWCFAGVWFWRVLTVLPRYIVDEDAGIVYVSLGEIRQIPWTTVTAIAADASSVAVWFDSWRYMSTIQPSFDGTAKAHRLPYRLPCDSAQRALLIAMARERDISEKGEP